MKIDYIYYRLYLAALKSSLKEMPYVLASVTLAVFLAMNIITIDAFLAKTISFPYFFKNYKNGGWVGGILITILLAFFNEKRRTRLIDKYSLETISEQKKGNILAHCYGILTVVTFVLVALYKPGKF